MKYILFSISFMLILSCNSSKEKVAQDTTEFNVKLEDKKLATAFLNRENSEYVIIKGTPTYDSILQHYPELTHKNMNRHEWTKDNQLFHRLQKNDSITFTVNEDTLEISHCSFISGSCGYSYLFSVIKGDTLKIYNPEVMVDAEVYTYKKDTFSMFTDCTLATINELIIKIPLSKSVEHKTIKYQDKIFKLK